MSSTQLLTLHNKPSQRKKVKKQQLFVWFFMLFNAALSSHLLPLLRYIFIYISFYIDMRPHSGCQCEWVTKKGKEGAINGGAITGDSRAWRLRNIYAVSEALLCSFPFHLFGEIHFPSLINYNYLSFHEIPIDISLFTNYQGLAYLANRISGVICSYLFSFLCLELPSNSPYPKDTDTSAPLVWALLSAFNQSEAWHNHHQHGFVKEPHKYKFFSFLQNAKWISGAGPFQEGSARWPQQLTNWATD